MTSAHGWRKYIKIVEIKGANEQSPERKSDRFKICTTIDFFKWAIRSLFFFYFRLFYKQLTVNMFNGLNRVRVHRYRKRPLCQLRHDHCPSTTTYCFFKKNWAIPGLFFVIFVFQYTVDSKQMFNINVNFCR